MGTILPFRAIKPTRAIAEQLRIGDILARCDEIWAAPVVLHRAMEEQKIPLNLRTCVQLAWARQHLRNTPRAEHGDYGTVLRSVINSLDVAVLRAASLDVDNPPIGSPSEPA